MAKKIMYVFVIVVTMAMLSFPQGRNAQYLRRQSFIPFDITSPVTIDGKIVKVETIQNDRGWYGEGVHLTVANGGKQSVVSMGPLAFLNSQNWLFKNGEMVSLKVFKGVETGVGMLFASEVRRDGKQLILRDKNGLSMWRRSLDGYGRGGYGAYGGRGYGAAYRGRGYGMYGRQGYGRGGRGRGCGYGRGNWRY